VIILDTNVLSELMRPKPADAVMEWFAGRPAASFYTTSITQAETLLGLALFPQGRRRAALETAAATMFDEKLDGRILPFGRDAAQSYASIVSERRRAGKPISHFDAQIAAIARSTGAALATRNVEDFQGCGVTLVDPWKG
jgi:predicted nucleic acid-binding protein